MKCNSCGAELADGSNFCNICGAKVVLTMAASTTEVLVKPDYVKQHRSCWICTKPINNKDDGYIIKEGNGLCKECAADLGYKNKLSMLGLNETIALNNYMRKHPEGTPFVKNQIKAIALGKTPKERMKKEAAGAKAERMAIANGHAMDAKKKTQSGTVEEPKKPSGVPKFKFEDKYTCTKCGHVWYVNERDKKINTANVFAGSLYTLNQVRDFSQCPKCGSKASKHEKEMY